ncbi:palmitoyl-(protein) hydrolase [Aureococcus anophagefferens]|uniref:Palmitoyl-(Protein) hydrolase n=1 Tax=Aureococcus anophagefferens TaxID=44056 RepID=A0ABR1FU04_AURAN
MWAVLLMAAAAAGLLATEGRTAQQIEAVAAALLAVDDLNAAYASDNITFTLAAAWGDYDVDVVEASTNATAGGFVVLAPPPCDAGTAWNGTACEACPPGFTRVEGDACAPCAPGSFSDDRLLCEPCDEYSYQPAFAAARRPRVPGEREARVPCAACPEGAVCRGYAYAPYNEKNYWADPANPAVVQECYNDGQCKRKFRCFEAYEGARVRSLVLAECELFDILLSYVQTVAIISSFHISWPKHARYLFVFFSLLLFDYGLCLVGTLKWYKVGGLLAAKLWREPEARSFRGVRDAFRFETGDLSDVAADALPAVLARFGWSFERFRSPLHFWYIVLKWRSILICAITTLDDGAVQLFCGSAVIACVIAVEQTLSLLFRPYEKTLLNGVDTAGFVLVAAFASSTIVLFSDEAHRFKQTWLVSVVAFVVAAFGAVAVHEVLAKRDRLFKQAATQETKRRFRVDDHRGILSKRLSELQHRARRPSRELVDRALHHHGRSSPSSRDAPKHAAEGGRRVDPELLLDAVAELSDTLCGPRGTRSWRTRTSDAVWDDYRDASLAIRPFNYPGVIDFVVEELTHVERTIYFGCMLRLERFLQKDGHTRLHDLIEEADRSSILYFLLSASKADADKLVTVLHGILRSADADAAARGDALCRPQGSTRERNSQLQGSDLGRRPRRARTDVAGRRPSYGLQDLATPGGVSSSLAAVQDQVSGHANEHHAKQHKTTVEDCEKVEVRAVLLSHVVTKKDADDEAPVVVVDDEMPEALGEVARRESRRALVPYPESLGAFFCASQDDPVVGIYACGD